VVPASMGLIVHQLLVIAICLVIGTWIERGRWAIAPEGKLTASSFFGMIFGFWLIVWFALLFWIGFVLWYHDLPRAAHLSAAIAAGAVYSLAVAALGVALGCWMADRERALQVIAAVSIPMLFLSGFAFPLESIPAPLVWFSDLLPTTHGIQLMLKFNQMGASWSEARSEAIRLALVTIGLLALAYWAAGRRARAASATADAQP